MFNRELRERHEKILLPMADSKALPGGLDVRGNLSLERFQGRKLSLVAQSGKKFDFKLRSIKFAREVQQVDFESSFMYARFHGRTGSYVQHGVARDSVRGGSGRINPIRGQDET